MKWPEIGYVRAGSLDDLWRIQAEHGPAVQVLAGGQTLLAALAFRLSDPGLLVDITRIAALQGIRVQDGRLHIGALTRHVTLGLDPLVRSHAPLLAEAVPHIAHPAIRNRGTIGGSLAYADPAAELPACIVALDATIRAVSPRGERRIAADAFFTGLLQTALEPDEIIAAIDVPVATGETRSTMVEVARRSGDYAMAGLAVCLNQSRGGTVASPRLVYFGVGTGPVTARRAAAALEGRVIDAGTIAAAQEALADDLDPPSDTHGPPEMKRHLSRVLTRRALSRFLPASASAA